LFLFRFLFIGFFFAFLLHLIAVNAQWYIPNKISHTDLKIPTITEEMTKFSVEYRDKITIHTNELAPTLLAEESRILKRFKPTDLTTRFS
jgi:hypothetical protein